jgi:WD repeat-containing protein 76
MKFYEIINQVLRIELSTIPALINFVINVNYRCHDRSLRTISVHPGTRQHIATTSSFNKEVAIWDLRKVSSKRPMAGKVSSIDFNKPLSSAFFSPITGKSILTTSSDDKVGVYDCTNLEKPTLVNKLTHDNHTGRWITNFRATWHPLREDVFVIGSMHRPDRKVEIFKVNP